jgi:hypothetical protein
MVESVKKIEILIEDWYVYAPIYFQSRDTPYTPSKRLLSRKFSARKWL